MQFLFSMIDLNADAARRAARQPASIWQQLKHHLPGLFSRDSSLRSAAAGRLLVAEPGLAAVQQSASGSVRNVAHDPFAGLLDNGIGAHTTATVAVNAALAFRYCVLYPQCPKPTNRHTTAAGTRTTP